MSNRNQKGKSRDRLGIDLPSPEMLKAATISPDRLNVPAQTMTIGELRDAFGQGLPILTDEVKKFLSLETEQIACVTSNFHIIYHPIVCMSLAADGLLLNYDIKLTNFNHQHACAPQYVNVPISAHMSRLSGQR